MNLSEDIRHGLLLWMKEYRRAGSPFGEGEEGLVCWIQEGMQQEREEESLTEAACDWRAIEAMKRFAEQYHLKIVRTPEGLRVGKRAAIEQPYREAGSPLGPEGIVLWYQYGQRTTGN